MPDDNADWLQLKREFKREFVIGVRHGWRLFWWSAISVTVIVLTAAILVAIVAQFL